MIFDQKIDILSSRSLIMFSKLILENFKSFDHFEVDFSENKNEKRAKKLCLIYGENGIGKTSIVDAFDLLVKSFYSIERLKRANDYLSKDHDQKNFYGIFSQYANSLGIKEPIEKYKRIGSDNNMSLIFESFIHDKRFVYSMIFSSKRIVEEKLMCNGDIIFHAGKKKLTLKPNFFMSDNLNNLILDYCSLYFGKHTILSCINAVVKEVDFSLVKKSVGIPVIEFMDSIEKTFIFKTKENESFFSFLNIDEPDDEYINDLLDDVFEGPYDDSLERQMMKTKKALTMFYSSLYANISGVDYRITSNRSGSTRTYKLHFIEKTTGDSVDIPYEKESTGTKKLLKLFKYFYYAATNNGTIIIDEIDNGINDILLKTIIKSLEKSIKGQLIFTTHNTLLLDYPIKNGVYLLDRNPDQRISCYSLDEFGRKIQAGTNLVSQYLKGLYGGVPQEGFFSMEYIVEAVKDNEQKN